jgi:hypothetical protein
MREEERRSEQGPCSVNEKWVGFLYLGELLCYGKHKTVMVGYYCSASQTQIVIVNRS